MKKPGVKTYVIDLFAGAGGTFTGIFKPIDKQIQLNNGKKKEIN